MKINMTQLLRDSTEKIKAEAGRNAACINFVDSHVRIRELYKTPPCIQGKRAFHVDCPNDKKGKIVEEIKDGNTIVIGGYFKRADEWKPTPWTEEERAAYHAHNMKESTRVDTETTRAMEAFKQREQLRKQFYR